MNSSKDVQAGEEIPVRNYALSSVSVSEPSLFEIMLFADGNTYRYGIEVNTKEVCREWLYIKSDKKRSKEIELFYLDGKRLIVDEFGSKLHTLLITRVISLFNTKEGNPNSDASYEKDYLLGKYGATPIIEDLSKALRYESKL